MYALKQKQNAYAPEQIEIEKSLEVKQMLFETQQLVFSEFTYEITQTMTISAFAMRIFTKHFYKARGTGVE